MVMIVVVLLPGYSHMQHRTYIENIPASLALVDWIESVYDGWDADFTPRSSESLEKHGPSTPPRLTETVEKRVVGIRRLSVSATQLVVSE